MPVETLGYLIIYFSCLIAMVATKYILSCVNSQKYICRLYDKDYNKLYDSWCYGEIETDEYSDKLDNIRYSFILFTNRDKHAKD